MENNNSFTLKDVIFNLLFIILFVFILLWLFPSKSFLKDNTIYNSEQVKTNQLFNDNITTMKEAAISYFTTSRLPKKVGDKITMTLRQMREEKLLLSLIDSNGNVCDEGVSYIEMTKEEDEYLLKVYLSCSDNEDYILVHLGCYDYCDGDICEKKEPVEILYEFKYKLEKPCTWTDWSKWSDWTANYISANSNRKVETKVETETIDLIVNKTCKEGYIYNEATQKCYKSVAGTEVKDAEKTVSYKCLEGYTYDEKSNKCIKESVVTTIIAALEKPATYNCNNLEGYILKGNKCVKTVSDTSIDVIDATEVKDYKCEKGTLSKDKKTCVVNENVFVSFKATCKSYQSCTTTSVFNVNTAQWEDKRTCVNKCGYICPSGYSRNGAMCSGYTNQTSYFNSIEFVSNHTCPEGYTKDGTKCIKETETTKTLTKEATKEQTIYYCEGTNYKLVDKTCRLDTKKIDEKEPEIIENYSCEIYGSDFSLNQDKCEKSVTNTESSDLIINTSCPEGYTKNSNSCTKKITKYRYSERSCVGGSIDYKWSDSDKDESLKELGYVLTGEKRARESK